ncbi:MAG: rhomboid family intramembrane serine protease [Verrucomicrobia bacterium]|nr:rhomboid family intramembrane serine protease [Verrucomicrobiota bacterium]
MRTIGEIDSETRARQFSDFLYVQGISNQIDPGNQDAWQIWVHSDDDLAKASQWLATFRANPDDQQFAAAAKASDLRAAQEKESKEFRQRVRTRDNIFRRFVVFGVGPLTAVLIAASVLVFFWTRFGNEVLTQVPFLLFSIYEASPDMFERLLGSPEIRSGEVWRLLTPMLVHMSIIHILFNMLWLRDLGGMVETLEGTGKLLALVVVSATISNWAQYVIGGSPLFGGMSGVVYALLGYVWMKGKYEPGSGLFLHKQTVTMMLIWLGFGFTNILPIANWAHLGGLVVGAGWGYAATRRA